MDCIISESYYLRAISQRNYRKMTITWSFSYNSFVKFHDKKNWSHIRTALYLTPCYYEVCYKETVLYCVLQGKCVKFVVSYEVN